MNIWLEISNSPHINMFSGIMGRDALLHRPRLTAAEALRYLEQSTRRAPNRELLQKGRLASDIIKSAIVNG